jgi:hypothetical protein
VVFKGYLRGISGVFMGDLGRWGRVFIGGLWGAGKKVELFSRFSVIPRGGRATILVWKQGAS